MKIDTKKVLKNLKGEDLRFKDEDDVKQLITVGEALSGILLSHQAGGKMKMFLLAEKASEQKILDVDKADFALIKKAVEETKIYGDNVLVPGQLLIYLEGLKEDSKGTK